MNNWIPSTEFEEKVKKSYQIPEVRQEFVQALQLRLETKEPSSPGKNLSVRKLSPAWAISMGLVMIVMLITLVVGPQEVWAAIGRLFGYIPGVGLVDENEEFRVLAEPVSQTRDGVTVTVSSALLTTDKTVILFSTENVPWEALSHEESVHGCFFEPQLRLPDGDSLSIWQGGGGMGGYRFEFPSISQDVDSAVFFLPCLSETLPGLAPENWELPLRFVPAPEGMEVIPVIEVPLSAESTESEKQPITILKALEIGDQYTLFIEFDPWASQDTAGDSSYWQLTEQPRLADGNGAEVFYLYPMNIEAPEPSNPGAQVFAFQFSKAITPPLSITFSGNQVSKLDEPRDFTVEFDAGADPLTQREWQINQSLRIGEYETILTSIIAHETGYSFNFDHGENSDLHLGNAHNVTVEKINIAGHTAAGGGGGGGGGGDSARVLGSLHLDYKNIPTGKLTINITAQLYQYSEPRIWKFDWAPSSMADLLFGIQPVVDLWLEDGDGYILIGHTEWTDPRLANVTDYGDMAAHDSDGSTVEIQKLTFAETSALVENLQVNQWAYRVKGKDIGWPLTLRLDKVNVEFVEQVRYQLDLRPYGFDFDVDPVGPGWKTGLQPLNVPGISASMFKATYVREGEFSGFAFEILADARLQNLALDYESGITGESQARLHRAGISDLSGALLVTVLTDGDLRMPLELVAYGADISGSWEGTFSP